jgi:cysteinyl-tRNA synthetase
MLQLTNTLTRKKETFAPQDPDRVTFYQCGPTVYWVQHLGNMRAMVLADLFVRTLQYLGYKVCFVRNYTDVGHLTSDQDTGEDKMEKGAQREGLTPEQIAQKYIEIFEADIAKLNCLPQPDRQKPRATQYIKEMQAMVQTLLDKGYAYATDLAIYYQVEKFANYTALSGQDLSKQIAEAGKGEVGDPQKKSAADFALWFFQAGAHAKALQIWPYEFTLADGQKISGQGFPGWHLECSVMSKTLLGETLDLHMGGVEHIPVHHTNEIAQSEAASGKKFVNYWLHNEHLLVAGGKMAKSSGTSYSLADVLVKGYSPLAVRYFFLQAHYRSRQNFTWEALTAAETAWGKLRRLVAESLAQNVQPQAGALAEKYQDLFAQAISDDFNFPEALSVVWQAVKDNQLPPGQRLTFLLECDRVLGLNLAEAPEQLAIPAAVQELAKRRAAARAAKDWPQADELRKQIEQSGYLIEDNKQGQKILKK